MALAVALIHLCIRLQVIEDCEALSRSPQGWGFIIHKSCAYHDTCYLSKGSHTIKGTDRVIYS